MRPEASIVIPCFNAVEYTMACVASIERHSQESHEIVLVDNGSTDGTSEWFQAGDHGMLVRNHQNLGFAVAANQGMEAAMGDTVVLLNNDALATPGWLTALLGALRRDPTLGVAVPRSNFVIDPQIIETVPYSEAPSEELDRFAADRHRDHEGEGEELRRISGLCMAIRRDLLETVGGFDARFGLGNFEDDDLALRARAAGWRLWLCDDSFVHHFGHRTFDRLPEDYDDLLARNAATFCLKWEFPLDRDPRGEDPPRPYDPERDRIPLHLAR